MTALTAAEVEHELRAWLGAHWDPELPLADWRRILADSGWACPAWPVEYYGKGLPAAMAPVVTQILEEEGVIGPPQGAGMSLAAPAILEHGSDALKRRLLPPIVTGQQIWCQLFSEPGNGSDLAGLTTRAEVDGDEYVVNGQKVWNTGAHRSGYAMLLARTNFDVPKHRGITYFALDMKQPGVEVRPLRQMNGHASFNEVFLTDARVPVENVIGDVGNGWAVALTTLANERRLNAGRGGVPDRGDGLGLREARAEAEIQNEPYRWYPQRAGRVDLVVERARATGQQGNVLVRQEAARLTAMVRAAEWTALRAQAARALGRQPGAEGSLGKLSSSNIARSAAKVHALIAGTSGTVSGADAPLDGVITEVLISVPAVSIAGGTDEIQHNIIGDRVLGLPKEPQVDRDLPFNQLPRNTGRFGR